MAMLALYWSIMIACYLLASRLRKYAEKFKFVDKLMSLSVYALVLLMGLRMGADEEVTSSLCSIGIQALFVTVLTAAGSMLGAFAAIYQQQGIGLGVYVLGVLPHGIFELSALILSCALGLLICRTGTERILKKSDTPFFRRVLDCIRVFLTFSVPLLLVAALIETYVTPALLNLVL